MISLRQTIAVIAAACFALAGCPCGFLSSVSASDVATSHAAHAGLSVHQTSAGHQLARSMSSQDADHSVHAVHSAANSHKTQAQQATQHPANSDCCQHFDDVAAVMAEISRSNTDAPLLRAHHGGYDFAEGWLPDGLSSRASGSARASQAEVASSSQAGLIDGQSDGSVKGKAVANVRDEADGLSLSVYDSASYIVGWFAKTLLQEASTPVKKADKLLN